MYSMDYELGYVHPVTRIWTHLPSCITRQLVMHQMAGYATGWQLQVAYNWHPVEQPAKLHICAEHTYSGPISNCEV